jgi:hypothetical protein
LLSTLNFACSNTNFRCFNLIYPRTCHDADSRLKLEYQQSCSSGWIHTSRSQARALTPVPDADTETEIESGVGPQHLQLHVNCIINLPECSSELPLQACELSPLPKQTLRRPQSDMTLSNTDIGCDNCEPACARMKRDRCLAETVC